MKMDMFDGVSFEISGDDLIFSGNESCVMISRKVAGSMANKDVEIFSIPIGSLNIDGETEVFDIYCQKRMKGDFPGCVRSNVRGDDFDVLAENGVLCADSVMMLKGNGKILLAGFLQLHRHLARIEWHDDGLHAIAEYNQEYRPASDEIVSQTVVLLSGNDPAELLCSYAEKVAAEYKLPQKPRVPRYTVGANWHYYGPTMTGGELLRELETIVKRKIRLDVYQIDDGWERDYGDWHPNAKFPEGMANAAEAIRKAGMIPGIWITPFLCGDHVKEAEMHPDWLLRDAKGNAMTMQIGDLFFRIFDPSHPDFRDWIIKELRNIYQWGFRYFKVDFCRCLFLNPQASPHDRSLTLMELYRLGISIIREALGHDSCLNICGGHESSIGLADISRSGRDTYGVWELDGGVWRRIRQCVMRSYLNRFRWNDPDASILRLNDEPLDMEKDFTPHRKMPGYAALSKGYLSDDEAGTMILNQFLGGGIIESGECFTNLSEERLAMLDFVIPACGEAVRPIDFFNPGMPRFYRTAIKPVCTDLEPWEIVSVINVSDEVMNGTLPLVFEKDSVIYDVVHGELLGIVKAGKTFDFPEIHPHASLVLKVMPVPAANKPFFVASTLHVSGGGTEIGSMEISGEEIRGTVVNPRLRKCVLSGAFPEPGGAWRIISVPFAGNGEFVIRKS